MEKLVYQMFILGTGECLKEALKKGLGGVIFFTKDIESKEQFKDLISKIKSQCEIPPFLSIDQEGGRVERTERIHERYLSPRFAFQKGEAFLQEQTKTIADELVSYGINLNFAPCADVNTNPDNPIIGERAFSDKTDEVIEGVRIVSETYRQNGIIPCIKHYPGHGDASKDSHLTLPEIDLPLKEMEKNHIRPFREAANDNIEMIMAAHLHCTCFDKDIIPASLSANAIGYLRNIIGYKGLIITDDMEMKGVESFGAVEASIMAILAGVDIILYREANQKTIEIIEAVIDMAEQNDALRRRILESNSRIEALKKQRLCLCSNT